jgi:trehalose synthase
VHRNEVEVRALPPERLTPLIGPERAELFAAAADAAREFLSGRTVLNINSTAAGGGVAELLQTLLAYARGAGVDTRWAVIEADPQFFEITKRIHNHLYGSPGDGGPLGDDEHAHYEKVIAKNARVLAPMVRPGDVVLLHDPQTAGLARALRDRGATVVWRCHVGIDEQNAHSEEGWEFLRRYHDVVDGFVFSREVFAPAYVPRDRLFVIAPSIDPFSAKNEAMQPADVVRALQYTRLVAGDSDVPRAEFTRRDGTRGTIDVHADLLGTGPVPAPDVPLVLQASRWDSMKDMRGVMVSFAEHLDAMCDAHLLLAGPDARGVADDPEGQQVLDECLSTWKELPAGARNRIHLACVPMHDNDAAAAIVNALQRHASVVTQKSFAEGFGLTVVEAMWKSRPVIGTAVGGIVDQIVDGETGYLIDDPSDLDAFADAMASLLAEPTHAAHMGDLGRRRAAEHFLGDRHLEQYADMFVRLATN